MLRWLTAGESHGPSIVGVLDGLPAGVALTSSGFAEALARRRLGHGRGARMDLEKDQVTVIGGLWRGLTTGAPLAVEIANSEWPKWAETMSADPAPAPAGAKGQALTKPRPGHADLPGMIKYHQSDARAVLERSSARETAARVALGHAAEQFLAQGLGIALISHVVNLGGIWAAAAQPGPRDLAALDASPVRTLDKTAETAMIQCIDLAKKSGDSLGGVVEVIAWNVPVGLGSYTQADRRLDGQLAAALMSIQAIKGVEIGLGFKVADQPGSQVHDPIDLVDGQVRRKTNQAGGIEGGMSNGEPIVIRAAMKPIPTLTQGLRTIDTSTGQSAKAHHQRSDVTAVPAAAIVAQAMTALVLARAALDRFGGDHLDQVKAALTTENNAMAHRLAER
ncbi:MAG: chorismate synthase [Micrococcales bacterium]|nr:chorismate synthase [Micrococcales bacterium]